MTPLKEESARLSLLSMAEDILSDGDTVVMDTSSVLTSPPRSCQSNRSQVAALHNNLHLHSTASSQDHEEPVASPALLSSHANKQAQRSRRLFDDNSNDGNTLDNMESLSLSSASRPTSRSHLSDNEPEPHQQRSRKRTSTERRQQESPRTPYRTQGNTLFPNAASNSNEATSMMSMSPHMSPNSYLTMDGRFVTSNNPFSSPLMDEDNLTPTPRPLPQQQQSPSRFQPAPTFPVSFDSNNNGNSKKSGHSILPRRKNSTMRSPLNGGFPDHRFSFTGSPIAEVDTMMDETPHRNPSSSPATLGSLMDTTETASSGSLHKVRRLSRNDDVVSSSSHHMKMSYPSRRLAVDTHTEGHNDDDVSPTDVQCFPLLMQNAKKQTPPTPIKSRRAPIPPPYARIQRQDPTTPARTAARQRAVAAHTPHPKGENTKSRFYGDFDVIGELGKGGFGTVYKVLSRLDGCMYAIKAAQRKAKGQADRDRMLKEVYALAALSDQADTATFHIVRYHQAWMEDERLYIQTELCVGTLADEIEHTGLLTEGRRYKMLREMLLALSFLHRNNMVHLDIKPENIFVKNDQFKLGDFGLVTKASAAQDAEEGDSRYMSMELLSGDTTDLTKSDIFSLGATMYELCLNRPLPMNGDEWQDLRAGRLMPLTDTGPDLAQLIQGMMNPVAGQRPAASELLQHQQLLSDEQKALIKERSKVADAKLQLAAQQFQRPPRKGLQRANTWNGSSMLPYL